MSKTLEYVDEKIKMLNVAIESAVKIVKEFDGIVPVDSYKKLVEEHLKEMQTLEQIKCELEALEEMKKHEFEIDRLDSFAEFYVIHIWKPFKPEEIEKLKKALEVKNET